MKSGKSSVKEGVESSLARGLLVLECFKPQKNGYTLSELVRKLALPKSSLHRVLKTLSNMCYLRYDEQTKRYHLGVAVLSLGFAVLQNMELREIARPYMDKFSRECNKTVNLAVLDKDEMVYVERIRVPGIRSFNISIGNRISPWKTAVGRAVLAHLEPEKLKQMITRAKASNKFNVNEDELFEILAKTRKDGFAVNNQEFLRGVLAVAAPIFSSNGVDGAINVVVEPENVTVETLKSEYAPRLIKLCQELSNAMGHRK